MSVGMLTKGKICKGSNSVVADTVSYALFVTVMEASYLTVMEA